LPNPIVVPTAVFSPPSPSTHGQSSPPHFALLSSPENLQDASNRGENNFLREPCPGKNPRALLLKEESHSAPSRLFSTERAFPPKTREGPKIGYPVTQEPAKPKCYAPAEVQVHPCLVQTRSFPPIPTDLGPPTALRPRSFF